jgi:hypothetical protein
MFPYLQMGWPGFPSGHSNVTHLLERETAISSETPTPQCSLYRHFIRLHSVDGPGELFNRATMLADLGNPKIALVSIAQLGSPGSMPS